MIKKFTNYYDCHRYLVNLRGEIQQKRNQASMMAYWRTLELILLDTDDVISCMEDNANEYIFTDSMSEYKEELTAYFGEEPVIEGDYVALTCAYKDLLDCEINKRGIVILVVDI